MKARRFALMFAIACLPLSFAAGCAKSPSVIDVLIEADDTVPPVLLLRTIVARTSAPTDRAIVEIVSGASGAPDADRPGPFVFPVTLPVRVPPSWSGPTTLTIEGLDWDTNKVNATGMTTATVTSEQTTAATLKLTGVAIGGGGDGGLTTDGGSTDAADAN